MGASPSSGLWQKSQEISIFTVKVLLSNAWPSWRFIQSGVAALRALPPHSKPARERLGVRRQAKRDAALDKVSGDQTRTVFSASSVFGRNLHRMICAKLQSNSEGVAQKSRSDGSFFVELLLSRHMSDRLRSDRLDMVFSTSPIFWP